MRTEIHEGRTGLGLGIVALAVISMAALASPEQDFFSDPQVLATHGGYLGASIAWALYSIAGLTISYVLLIGLMLVGFIITGLSITGLVDWVRDCDVRRARAGRAHHAGS